MVLLEDSQQKKRKEEGEKNIKPKREKSNRTNH